MEINIGLLVEHERDIFTLEASNFDAYIWVLEKNEGFWLKTKNKYLTFNFKQ